MYAGITSRRGFTLIELLVVIAIIAILAVVVVLTLNPAQLLAQSRDSTRISDMGTLNDALNLYTTDQNGASSFSLGSSSVTYVSIADSAATTTAGDACTGLGMPSLASGDAWQCPASSTAKGITGTGWIPVNFNNISSGAPLGTLPEDPVNQTSTNLYYTYTTNGSQYEVNAVLESQKYKSQFGTSVEDPKYPEVLAQGSNLALSELWNPSGLVGYWPLDEGSNTVAEDESGNGNNGAWSGTQTGSSGYYSSGKVGTWSGQFDGSTDYVNTTNIVDNPSALTVAAWIKATSGSMPGTSVYNIVAKTTDGSTAGWQLGVFENSLISVLQNSGGSSYIEMLSTNSINDANWHFVVWTLTSPYTTSSNALYVDGASVASVHAASGSGFSVSNASNLTIGSLAGGGAANAHFSGQIDDVRVYSRAFSAAEVLALYNAEK